MPESMYDRLGDFLKDALDSGEIPQYEANYFSFENKVEEHNEQKKNSSIFFKLKRNPNPKEERAFSKLECTPENSFEEIKKIYHQKLKQLHPDTSNVKKSENTEEMIELINAYEILKALYGEE